MFSEDDLLQLSGLQHLAFCERQWGLIHLEGVWMENLFTAQGRLMHDRAHEYQVEKRGDLRIVRALWMHSLRLGLSGKADVVEFHKLAEEEDPSLGAKLPHTAGLWKPFPVEYKRGRPKKNRCDEIQLCAQAICLEEMLEVRIPAGALFYGRTKKRTDVAFDQTLRGITESLSKRMHELTHIGITPPPEYGKKCESCSIKSACMPKETTSGKNIQRYIESNML